MIDSSNYDKVHFMRVHSREKIEKLKDARKKGMSILDLVKEFSMPKTTIWHHIHDIKLNKSQIRLIKSGQGGSKKRSESQWRDAKMEAERLLKSAEKNFYILFASLYWAEGNKKGFIFTNTDGKMIKLFILILKKYFHIQQGDIKITIRVFSNLNEKRCVRYWSEILDFPKKEMRVYMNDGGTKGKAEYGICRITVKNGGCLNKLITSLIYAIYNEVVLPP